MVIVIVMVIVSLVPRLSGDEASSGNDSNSGMMVIVE